MTRTFMWVVAGSLLAGALVTARHFVPPGDNGALRDQVQALNAELQSMREQMHQRDRARGQSLPQLMAAAAHPAPAQPAPETPEEEDARVEVESSNHELKLAGYHSRMDRELRLAPPAPARRSLLQKNVEALAQSPRSPLIVDSYECAERLCRIEVRRQPNVSPGAIGPAVLRLAHGMAELTMRPFEGDRSVIYAAPTSHKLPPVDL